MIVLDEQLLEPGLQAAIQRWYRGAVVSIRTLRPASLILDEAIPSLLRTVRQPTFVTINVDDFWRHTAPDARFVVICLANSQGIDLDRAFAATLEKVSVRDAGRWTRRAH